MGLYVTLFVAGALTILLPCILPLVPIVLGASIVDKNKWRPLAVVAGMVVSFVGFTFVLLVILKYFVHVADYMRIGTYYVLLLFGLGFLTKRKDVQLGGAVLGSIFFLPKDILAVVIVAIAGLLLMHLGGEIATRIQGLGAKTQEAALGEFGNESLLSAVIIGLTMGLVWVPCAGPALGFAFALVREQPGPEAFLALTTYGIGAAIPLLLVGYGGQAAVHTVRSLTKYSGHVKHAAGAILILTAIALNYGWLRALETYLVQNTSYGTLGTRIEEKWFGDDIRDRDLPQQEELKVEEPLPPSPEPEPTSGLPKLVPAPELIGLGEWLNSEPFLLEDLRGQVVLLDFWTYSCINCIRTLPYLQDWWEKYEEDGLVVLGVHTPEFVFEKDVGNLKEAVNRHGLTYPIVQDNDYTTWKAFNNRYWPAKYLIDADGVLRYMHFGEGKYMETENAIMELLEEADANAAFVRREGVKEDNPEGLQTPEKYLGDRGWGSLGNADPLPTEEVVTYEFPESFDPGMYYLEGKWQMVDGERQVLRGTEGKIAISFTGDELNLIMGVEEGGASYVTARVMVDGSEWKDFTFSFHNLYNLFEGEYGEHEVILEIRGIGTEAYAFTFGS